MKQQEKSLFVRIQAVFALSLLCITPIMPMRQAQSLLTPAQQRAFAAKRAVLLQKTKPIWVRTHDNELMALAQWKINEIGELKSLVQAQKEENSQTNPINTSMITKAELELLSTALSKIATGSAFLGSYFLPTNMQKYLMVPQIITPVVDYLKDEILKENKLYPTRLAGHQGKVSKVAFSHDGKVAMTTAEGERNNIIIWNGQTGAQLQTITVSEGDVDSVSINHDGSKIVTAVTKHFEMQELSKEKTNTQTQQILILWDTKTGKQIKVFDNLPDTAIISAKFSSDGNRIVAAIGHGEIITDPNQENKKLAYIIIVDSVTGTIIATHKSNSTILIKNNDAVEFILNPRGNTLLARLETNLILYDVNRGKEIKRLPGGPTESSYAAEYTTDGTKIITGDFTTQTVSIWNGTTGDQITQFNVIDSFRATLNYDGTRMLIVTHPDSTDIISVWDVTTKTMLRFFDSQQRNISSLQFSPDSTMIVSAGEGNKNIILWDAVTGTQLRTLDGHVGKFIDVEFSSDGKRIQSHSGQPTESDTKCTFMLWNTATGEKIHTFIAEHELVEMDPSFLNIISPDNTNDRNFSLWTSFNKNERDTLSKIENNLSLSQAHLLYQLYTAKISNTPILFPDNEQMRTLPLDVQYMLKKYLSKPLPAKMMPVREIIVPTEKQQETPKPQQTWWQWLTTGR